MRRAHSVLVIMALLATPLALFAHGCACNNSSCGMMCCLPHGHFGSSSGQMDCEHCPMCQGKSQHKSLDVDLIAPMAPTFTESVAYLAAPPVKWQHVSEYTEFPVVASLPVPLKPPRA